MLCAQECWLLKRAAQGSVRLSVWGGEVDGCTQARRDSMSFPSMIRLHSDFSNEGRDRQQRQVKVGTVGSFIRIKH